jgi:hypothetical protein
MLCIIFGGLFIRDEWKDTNSRTNTELETSTDLCRAKMKMGRKINYGIQKEYYMQRQHKHIHVIQLYFHVIAAV